MAAKPRPYAESFYNPTEAEEQAIVFQWAHAESNVHPELKVMFHIPNEGKRSIYTGKLLKSTGLKAGVPDIFLPVARGRYHGLFVEMKRKKGGSVSEAQKRWQEALSEQGFKAVICWGAGHAIETIMEYLSYGTT